MNTNLFWDGERPKGRARHSVRAGFCVWTDGGQRTARPTISINQHQHRRIHCWSSRFSVFPRPDKLKLELQQPPRSPVRLAAMGSGANRPSAFNKARSFAAST